ncbi:hypothetical protein KY310_02180 [Candidatus Woesearchaeota archaeon]|nr:hypothetical protein [Candidatus Woesearchaeota archaeon]
MIPHPKHDYLLFMAVLILVIAAMGAVALHYGGATAAAGKVTYHPCQQLYQDYQKYNCNWRPEQPVCAGLRVELESRNC